MCDFSLTRVKKMNRFLLWCLLQFSSFTIIVQGKLISCVCTTDPCIEQQTSTCNTTSMCFSQYLDRGDGNNPVVKGCITTKTPLLCENRRPAVHHAKWPVLVCCSKNMCNQDVEPTPSGGAAVKNVGSYSSTTPPTTSSTSTKLGEAAPPSEVDHKKTSTKSVMSSVYVLVLVAGICSLLVIGGIAVLVLRRQSNLYDQEFGAVQRNGYLKGQTVEIASADIRSSSQPKIIGRTYDNKLVLSS